ncbi:hypothetical protein PsYK624_082490 [Phanerochaete sordida]|uniref:Uncharacterized protein n=1 Tax=Phanerochaete sordida TaxID=48140 RepID=A0A9P3LE33_9APHY|nr:hypothetical protein PsYK624_082490 [Phanerochaete sordida]
MRRFDFAVGMYISRSLRCTPSIWASWHIQVFAAFDISEPVLVPGDAVIYLRFTGESFAFFLLLAATITLETLVVDISRDLG